MDIDHFMEKFKPVLVFGGAWVLCGLAGLASVLRGDKPLNRRVMWASVVNSSIFGVLVGMAMWYWKGSSQFTPKDCVFILFVSGFAAMGGVDLVVFLIIAIKKSIRAKLGLPDPVNPTEHSDP